MAGYNYLDVNPKLDKWITDTETGALIGVRQCQEKTLTVWNISNSTPGVFTSSQLATALTDETGSGAAVFATSPTLVTPTLGVATATSVQGIIGNVTPASGSFTALTSTTSTTLASEAVALTTNNLPTVRPTLLLDFANSKSVDPRITFTRASTATRCNDKGLIETVVSGAPRIDYDPVTLACKGLLIEESRTNLLTYSAQFDNAAWTKSNCTVTANAATAPDGATTADTLVENTSNAAHFVQQGPITTVGTTTYTASVFAKAGTRTKFEFLAYIGSVPYNIGFDLSNGTTFASTLGGNTATSYSITAVGGGWYRCKITQTADATATSYFRCALNNGTVSTYTGDGTSGIYIWGAQLEAGSFPTSYIPTTSAQVTRAADTATMTGANFSSWYRQDEGTVVVHADASNGGSIYPRLWCVSDGTQNNFMQVFVSDSLNALATETSVAGVAQTMPASFASYTGESCKAVLAIIAGNTNFSKDGAIKTDANTVSIPTVSRLNIGSDAVSGSQLNGHISKLYYYPTRLANSTLQALSTP